MPFLAKKKVPKKWPNFLANIFKKKSTCFFKKKQKNSRKKKVPKKCRISQKRHIPTPRSTRICFNLNLAHIEYTINEIAKTILGAVGRSVEHEAVGR